MTCSAAEHHEARCGDLGATRESGGRSKGCARIRWASADSLTVRSSGGAGAGGGATGPKCDSTILLRVLLATPAKRWEAKLLTGNVQYQVK